MQKITQNHQLMKIDVKKSAFLARIGTFCFRFFQTFFLEERFYKTCRKPKTFFLNSRFYIFYIFAQTIISKIYFHFFCTEKVFDFSKIRFVNFGQFCKTFFLKNRFLIFVRQLKTIFLKFRFADFVPKVKTFFLKTQKRKTCKKTAPYGSKTALFLGNLQFWVNFNKILNNLQKINYHE